MITIIISSVIGFLCGVIVMCCLQINNDEVKLKSENVNLKRQVKLWEGLYKARGVVITYLNSENYELQLKNEKLEEKLYNKHIPNLY